MKCSACKVGVLNWGGKNYNRMDKIYEQYWISLKEDSKLFCS